MQGSGPQGLNLLSATDAAEKITSGETTSVAIMEDCLARIAAREPDIHAWAFVDPEIARRQARVRDQEPPRSAFHGVPIGIKDIFDTFDMPTAYGSSIYQGHRPATDTAIVGLLRRAGLVILGKCATTELASPVPIGVKNPHVVLPVVPAFPQAGLLLRSPTTWFRFRSARRLAARPFCPPPFAACSDSSQVLPELTAAVCGICGQASTRWACLRVSCATLRRFRRSLPGSDLPLRPNSRASALGSAAH